MELLLSLFVALCALELSLWLPFLWPIRKVFSAVLIILNCLLMIALLITDLRLWIVILAILSMYRAINLLRIYKGRTRPEYLYNSSRRSVFWLISLQGLNMGVALLGSYYHLTLLPFFYIVAVVQAVAAVILLSSTQRHLRTTTAPKITSKYADKDLPSLTVAIPARNETEDLEACLQSLIASKYPKLEILVLDDCSQNKRTPEIIRGFAHDGVRFIAGKEPPTKWLAKNYGYHQLAEAASGELLLFCGVDIRFTPDSLNILVETLLQKQKSMISLIPSNSVPKQLNVAHLLTQPNRYTWELALPRRLFKRPPVLSSCWLIAARSLEAAGGFAAITRQPVPESYFAHQTASHNDGYSFLQSSAAMAISSHKQPADQQATAIRTRYPQLHRRPELIVLLSLAEFVIFVWPIFILISALLTQVWGLAAIVGFALTLQSVAYSKIVKLTFRQPLYRAEGLVWVAALYDIWLLNYSMWQYEFSEVIWKGRNVCIPIMRVLPSLPKA
ncbi:MAG: glycosyltransferase family A protein [Patescibacteria group bacterium]